MLTYELNKQPGLPLYEALYRCIREDILSGKLTPGQKLPSKRALAQHLKVSNITVQGAYDQLLAEGYIYAQPRVGYFAEAVERRSPVKTSPPPPAEKKQWEIDLTVNASTDFPFSVFGFLVINYIFFEIILAKSCINVYYIHKGLHFGGIYGSDPDLQWE